jgi:hypothetical protein
MAGSGMTVVTDAAWVSLGAAPVMVQAVNNPVMIAIADDAPDVGSRHFLLARDTPNYPRIFYPADGSSNVYAIAISGSASVVSSICTGI